MSAGLLGDPASVLALAGAFWLLRTEDEAGALDGGDDARGPVSAPDESAVRAFESVVKDVHQ